MEHQKATEQAKATAQAGEQARFAAAEAAANARTVEARESLEGGIPRFFTDMLDGDLMAEAAAQRSGMDAEATEAYMEELIDTQLLEKQELTYLEELLRALEEDEFATDENKDITWKNIVELEESIAEREGLIKALKAASAKRSRPSDLPTGEPRKRKKANLRRSRRRCRR